MRRPLLHAWAVAAVLLAGCTLRAPRLLRPTTAQALLDGVAARRAAVTTLRARARLRAGLRGVWVREAVLVRRPDAVRVDVLSPFGLAVAIGVHGTRLWAFPPAEGILYEGPATPSNLTRFLAAPVGVTDVVDILLGVPPAREAVGPPVLAATDEGEYRVHVPLRDGIQTIWFAGDTHEVVRAEERRSGVVVLRVLFEDYRSGFPHTLEVTAPPTGARARLAYEAVEPNVGVDAALFAPPPAPRVLPLDAAVVPPA